MKRTIVDQASGEVVCPRCGARNNFVSKRTGRAKVFGVAAFGVGVLAMPKRLQCSGCGAYLKPGGGAVRPTVRASLGLRDFKRRGSCTSAGCECAGFVYGARTIEGKRGRPVPLCSCGHPSSDHR